MLFLTSFRILYLLSKQVAEFVDDWLDDGVILISVFFVYLPTELYFSFQIFLLTDMIFFPEWHF